MYTLSESFSVLIWTLEKSCCAGTGEAKNAKAKSKQSLEVLIGFFLMRGCYSTYAGALGMLELCALSWLIQSWALLVLRIAATFSIASTLCSLLKLLAGTRRFSQLSLKCVMSPESTTRPVFGPGTSSGW